MIHKLPRIFITPEDHRKLKRVVRFAYNRHRRTAPFLDAEVRRAEVNEPLPKHVVKPGSLVRYQLDWGPFTPVRELVYPNYFASDETQISLLSEIGIALLGLRRGDTIQVLLPGVGFQTLHVATVRDPKAEFDRHSSFH
jgi:regulator of nucleoside diphosphate kinase